MQETQDFLEEATSLADMVARLSPAQWRQATPFKQWSPWEVVAHLALSDLWAQATLRGREDFAVELQQVNAALARGVALTDYTRARFTGLDGPQLLSTWKAGVDHLCRQLDGIEPQRRLAWFGPDMAPRTFISARFMETWAHGQDIYDLLYQPRVYRDSVRSIAFLGVRTFAFTYINRGLEPPATTPQVTLTAPSGAIWELSPPSEAGSIVGEASDFCHVVTQGRNVLDTRLEVVGDIAHAWMKIAQCFAGPPEDPPPPGYRTTSVLQR